LHCEDGIRTAAVTTRGDWHDFDLAALARTVVATFDATQRAAALDHWTTVALMEHASVASFARFTMDLMTFGAPPELLARAQQAAGDEVRHAKLAFAVASALGDEEVGPGAMRLDDVPMHEDLEAFATALVREGCVGETMGAAEAAEAARGVTPDALRTALTSIADDEQRHAVLAWKTLQWAWPQLSRDARARVMAAAGEEAARLSAPRSAPGTLEGSEDEVLRRVGVLGLAETTGLRRTVWTTVAEPTLRALNAAL
jgi:hypothetical protein